MKRRISKILVFAMAFVMCFSSISTGVGAAYTRKEYALDTISSRVVSSYDSMSVSYGTQQQSFSALMINDTAYVPFRHFMSALVGAKVNYDSATRTIYASMDSLAVSVSDGAYVVWANSRPIFATTPARILADGRMYITAEQAAKIAGLTYSLSYLTGTLSFSGKVRTLEHASSYYDEECVLWLARIITAESQGESLIGQIAVGSVVMNRVRSSEYPNTIWGVIFDKRGGTQFSPVANGTIYNTPTASAILAAKICLEGTLLSDDILFFLAPRYASSSWISANREYQFSIGGHDFYA